jgi:predicted nicotinamide N-methyase
MCLNMSNSTLPALFPDAPVRELVLPFRTRTFSLLVLENACALHSTLDGEAAEVYWGDLWPAALALAGALLDHAIDLPPNSAVLEIGCGAGLISLAAAAAGGPTTRVIATDREPRALLLAAENARRNGLSEQIATRQLNWSERSTERYSLILAGDCLYQSDACWQLAGFIRDSLADGGRAIVVDPDRWSARNFGLLARQAGLNVRTFQRRVPFAAAHGPVREICLNPAVPLDATFYELTIS